MNIDQVQIRPAVESDVSDIFALICELAEYEELRQTVVATEEDFRRQLFGECPAAEVLMATFGCNAVGFALFFTTFSTFVGKPGIYVEDIFVRPEARGKGIGRALVQRIAKLAVDRDCGRVEWSVLNWNEPAIRFYHSLGAKPLADWTMYRLAGQSLIDAASA